MNKAVVYWDLEIEFGLNLPWEGGLGSCCTVEWLYSERKSCVGLLPVKQLL